MEKSTVIAALTDTLEKAKDGQFDQVLVMLDDLQVRSLVSLYINNIGNELTTDDEVIIEMIIRILQEIYNNSTILSPIPDDQYDQLYEVHRDVNGTEIVGASSTIGGPKVFHRYPDLRGTLDKIHFITESDKRKPTEKRKSLEKWMNSTINRLGRDFRDDETIIQIFPKWDGVSEIFECSHTGEIERVLPRGFTDLNEADDHTKMFKGTSTNFKDEYTLYEGGEFGVKTEVVMRRSDYERFQLKYGEFKSPRSAVSSIFNTVDLNPEYLEYLTIIPLQVQDFTTKQITIAPSTYSYPSYTADLRDFTTIRKCIAKLQDLVQNGMGIDIDGVVIRLMSPHVQTLLGRDGKINKYEVAFKFPAVEARTTLLNVDFSVGILGGVTPVARVEPVKMKGNTIRNISLGSLDRFESLNLHAGDEVILKYDVIPYLDKDETCADGNGPLILRPTHCPVCGLELQNAPTPRCTNLTCDSRAMGKIENYVTKMRIADIGEGKIAQLFEAGFLTGIEDLYRLSKHRRAIAELPGFGDVSINKIIIGVDHRRSVYDHEVLGSIGIPNIGRKIFKKVLNAYPLEELIKIVGNDDYKKLVKIPGIKDNTAWKIILGMKGNLSLVEFLLTQLDIKHDDREYSMKVLFTKCRPSEKFAEHLDEQGVAIVENYSKGLNLVIVPTEGTTSGKVKDAVKDGVDVVTLETAYRIFEYKPE